MLLPDDIVNHIICVHMSDDIIQTLPCRAVCNIWKDMIDTWVRRTETDSFLRYMESFLVRYTREVPLCTLFLHSLREEEMPLSSYPVMRYRCSLCGQRTHGVCECECHRLAVTAPDRSPPPVLSSQ